MENIMLDLETMATSSNAAIVAIGAVKFDVDFGVTERFYRVIDLQSCIKRGLEVDASTEKWWSTQSEAARKEIAGENGTPQTKLRSSLKAFMVWIGKGDIQMWGNGSDFDNTIMRNAYQKYSINNPWDYRHNRCYRTMIASFPNVEVPKIGILHKAVDDAEYQANRLIALVEKYKLSKVL